MGKPWHTASVFRRRQHKVPRLGRCEELKEPYSKAGDIESGAVRLRNGVANRGLAAGFW